jgi:predicted TIM-barrel fold metal-dependent hydrolase
MGPAEAGDDAAPLLIVSADGHWGGPPSMYRDYLDPDFRADLDALIEKDRIWREGSLTQRRFSADTLDLIDPDGTVRSGGESGAWDVTRRLAEMDRSGVAAEVLLPGHQETVLPFFSQVSPPAPPAHRAAGARAYHRQLADALVDSGGRLVAVADAGPCHDIDGACRELEWVAAHGFVGVSPPLNIADPELPPLVHPRYEPFWQACADLDLALVVHAGYGFPQGLADGMAAMNAMAQSLGTEEMLRLSTLSSLEMSVMRIDQFPADHPFRTALVAPRRVFWQLMLAGVFDRHRGLKLVFTEIRADWVPATLDIFDSCFSDRGLKETPRHYWRQHVYVAPSSTRKHEVAIRHQVGLDRFMFGTDYPHPEGTWPNTLDWIRDAFGEVPTNEARLLLGLNAVDCYRLDASVLRPVADRVGPRPEDVLGPQHVDDRLRAQFHDRSGYLRPAEQVTVAAYEGMIRADEDALAASRG